METCERAGIALVILDEPSAAGGPGEGSLDNPTPRQQHEATLGLRQSHHLQGDPVRLRGGGGLVSGKPWSTKPSSTLLSVSACTACVSRPTSPRSSASAGGTCSATTWPGGGTPRCHLVARPP